MTSRCGSRTIAPLLALGLAISLHLACPGEPVVRVGSKAFTESFILGEIVADVIERAGEARVERKFGLGDTGITYRAVAHGDIDLYPEYTGTLSQMILGTPSARLGGRAPAELQGAGLTIGNPLGFSNTYALAVRRRDVGEAGPAHDLRPRAALRARRRLQPGLHRTRRRLARTQAPLRSRARPTCARWSTR